MFSTKFSPCKSEKINDLSRNGNLQTGFNQAGSDSAGLAIIWLLIAHVLREFPEKVVSTQIIDDRQKERFAFPQTAILLHFFVIFLLGRTNDVGKE